MPEPAILRSTAAVGLLTALLLLVNDARRVGLLPDTDLLTAIAPVPAVLALLAVVGLGLGQRERAGRVGAAGAALLLAGTAGLLVVEFSTHYVFRGLDPATVAGLVTPRVRAGFLTIAALFALGTVLFTAGGLRAGRYPRWALGLFAVGFLLAATRGFTPEWVVSLGFLVGPAGLVGLCLALYRDPQPGAPAAGPRPNGSRSRGSGVGAQRPSTTA
ncbi:hypothetical protein [Pseudonocardia lacus]|uniref:hypothetical protein n=1 Tax=Pseudonocardia lacus TaxID=2835865 RepID=UPI001BDDBD64|nr:hypothetical protein [Pseudonocardia lacus]